MTIKITPQIKPHLANMVVHVVEITRQPLACVGALCSHRRGCWLQTVFFANTRPHAPFQVSKHGCALLFQCSQTVPLCRCTLSDSATSQKLTSNKYIYFNFFRFYREL